MTAEGPNLRSLSPAYVADQHEDYVEILTAELTKTGLTAPRNVALTGHYGSGKSSVLAEAQRRLEQADLEVINLSLPSLGVGAGRIPKDGDLALEKTNLIQKEIVKQLLYRRKPSDTPASRFNRLDTFHVRPARWHAGIISTAVTGLALVTKLPDHVKGALPPNFWAWLDNHLSGSPSGLLQWLSLLIVFGMTFLAAMRAQRVLQQRHVTELAAGPTKVTLSESSTSYFDEYLDEIVYFFQTSKTTVVIFEDLDRFKDPHIFETLRELNLLLNNAEQTGGAPIRFVYAIRDSVFEQLDAETEEANINSASDTRDDGTRASAQIESDLNETRRLMSTNRTKFFDLVVPMVPFISHRTSRDLIRQELEAIHPTTRPSNVVIDVVGAYLTDMRLIKNICNEYEVFRRRILTDDGLKELSADRLFASIVYKNLYLADYEKIRYGTSRLDMLYGAYREWISHQTAQARAAERQGRIQLRRIDGTASRSARLGQRLREVLEARHAQRVKVDNMQLSVGATGYSWADLSTAEFWRAYVQDRGDLTVSYPNPYAGNGVLPFENVEILMGQTLSSDDWSQEDRAQVKGVVDSAVADQLSFAHVSMTGALGQPDKLFLYHGDERSLVQVAEHLFEGAALVLELLRAGFIDENFTLYITQFPGQAISASAMNFVIKAVQPDVMSMEYHFGTGEDVQIEDIQAVLQAEPDRLFGGRSVYNIEIFDFLLSIDSDRLDEPIRRLASTATTHREFLDAYLMSGKEAANLIRRLSASWQDTFGYLIEQDSEAVSHDLLNAALAGVSPEVTYSVDPEHRNVIMSALANLEEITAPQTSQRATDVARVLAQMGIRAKDLVVVAEPLRSEVVARNLYPVCLPNLRTIVHGDDSLLCLEAIKDAHETDVYPYVLSHLADYFSALDVAHAVPSVANGERFGEVLSDVGNASPDHLEEVARRANAECKFDDLDVLAAGLWPSVARAHRLALTATNVAAYIEAHGVDEPIGESLCASGAIEVDDEATPLGPLAIKLLNAEALTGECKLNVVNSLHLDPGSVPAASLEAHAHPLLPPLVAKGLVEDDSSAYTCLGEDDWPTKEMLITASKVFPEYMAAIPLSTKDLHGIASRPVPDGVKDALLNDVGAFQDKMGPQAAAALASWAARTGRTPKAETIVALASKGGAASARSILILIGAQASTIDIESLKNALDALDRPYSQLTTPGRDRPKVPVDEGVVPVLARLRQEGIVSKYEEKSRKSVYDVSKRYS